METSQKNMCTANKHKKKCMTSFISHQGNTILNYNEKPLNSYQNGKN